MNDNDHDECVMPNGVRGYTSRLGGNYVATCDTCGHVWAYWDCVCELDHECVVA